MKHYYSDTEESREALKDLQERTKNTMRERYGVDYALQNEDLLNKLIQTNIANWGVEWTFQHPDVIQKVAKLVWKDMAFLTQHKVQK